MSEIEKMYKNAGIKKVRQTNIAGGDYPIAVAFEDYPQFTEEKQIRILKCLTVNRGILIKQNVFFTNLENTEKTIGTENIDSNFEEGFASLINILWQNLTQSERKQIREILNVF